MSPRRNWHAWDNYQVVHERKLAGFLGHFILDDQLEITVTQSQVLWRGVLYCVGNLELHVTKAQDVEYRQGRPYVRTRRYAYHLQRRIGDQVTYIFRYDNGDRHEGHPDNYHCHRYHADGSVTVEHIGEQSWPLFDAVIEESRQWWLTHSQ